MNAVRTLKTDRVQPTGRPAPMEQEMTSDNDYVYDEEMASGCRRST